jgi:multidrug resistance efflux pump
LPVNQLLAEIDPVLADAALTAAKATLSNITAQLKVKQAQLALANAEHRVRTWAWCRRDSTP